MIVLSACFLGILLAFIPVHAFAEGNEPTITPLPTSTATLAPTNTPTPTEELLEDKSITQPDLTFDENAAPLSPNSTEPESNSLIDSLGGANLCLIGGIVLGTIVVIVMVVFGVIQRIRVED
jgi:hypothetical protein